MSRRYTMSEFRRASQRVVALTGRHGRTEDDPLVIEARQDLLEQAILQAIARYQGDLPPLPKNAQDRILRALDAQQHGRCA